MKADYLCIPVNKIKLEAAKEFATQLKRKLNAEGNPNEYMLRCLIEDLEGEWNEKFNRR